MGTCTDNLYFEQKYEKVKKFQLKNVIFSAMKYYTIIDFNEVDIRIYLPEKVVITEAARPR